MATIQLDSQIRTKTGKGPARKLRDSGKLPAIFYGPDAEPIMLSVDYLQLKKLLKGKSAENILFDLTIDSGKKSQPKKVMIKELQKDPVTRDYLHVDFYEIAMEKEIEAEIPLQLVGIPKGVSEDGGILEHIRREVKVSCLPNKLVDKIDVDVSELDIGSSLHIGDISLPPGLKAMEDEDFTIATVVAPAIMPEEEAVEEEEAEEEAVEETEGEEVKGEEES